MTGLELAEQLQNERLEFPVILFARNTDISKVIAGGAANILVIPYRFRKSSDMTSCSIIVRS